MPIVQATLCLSECEPWGALDRVIWRLASLTYSLQSTNPSTALVCAMRYSECQCGRATTIECQCGRAIIVVTVLSPMSPAHPTAGALTLTRYILVIIAYQLL